MSTFFISLLLLPSFILAAPVKTPFSSYDNVFENVDFFKGVDVGKAVKEVNGLSEVRIVVYILLARFQTLRFL